MNLDAPHQEHDIQNRVFSVWEDAGGLPHWAQWKRASDKSCSFLTVFASTTKHSRECACAKVTECVCVHVEFCLFSKVSSVILRYLARLIHLSGDTQIRWTVWWHLCSLERVCVRVCLNLQRM